MVTCVSDRFPDWDELLDEASQLKHYRLIQTRELHGTCTYSFVKRLYMTWRRARDREQRLNRLRAEMHEISQPPPVAEPLFRLRYWSRLTILSCCCSGTVESPIIPYTVMLGRESMRHIPLEQVSLLQQKYEYLAF